MDQELKNLEETIVETDAIEAEISESGAVSESNLESETQNEEFNAEDYLQSLISKRRGTFKINLSYSDATYLRNRLDKSEWVGPQQAYLLIISKLEMSSICENLSSLDKKSSHEVEISSATIESLSYFLNKATGVGEDSAQKLFAASMLLRPALSEMGRIDEEIKELQGIQS
jgi:hypothetical protein